MRGWRGQAPRQPGQVRKEAAVTSPAWVVVSLSPFVTTLGSEDAWRLTVPKRLGAVVTPLLSA